MYVVFAEELETAADAKGHLVQTLEQAFAQIACRCGYNYHFEQEQDGWKLVLTDVERPECSPEPIISSYQRPRDAKPPAGGGFCCSRAISHGAFIHCSRAS
jgi:hypothetical protein